MWRDGSDQWRTRVEGQLELGLGRVETPRLQVRPRGTDHRSQLSLGWPLEGADVDALETSDDLPKLGENQSLPNILLTRELGLSIVREVPHQALERTTQPSELKPVVRTVRDLRDFTPLLGSDVRTTVTRLTIRIVLTIVLHELTNGERLRLETPNHPLVGRNPIAELLTGPMEPVVRLPGESPRRLGELTRVVVQRTHGIGPTLEPLLHVLNQLHHEEQLLSEPCRRPVVVVEALVYGPTGRGALGLDTTAIDAPQPIEGSARHGRLPSGDDPAYSYRYADESDLPESPEAPEALDQS